ncbi:hypothetical protein LIER_11538 [Lithospermum erythrorhizon]|uniref:Uncharacterized protein n=1 Tax=Lithospermum erythrorhizon TaxID=34254 RepID=A0AAV3PNF2_LITER
MVSTLLIQLFVKSIRLPHSEPDKLFAKYQEGCRKDIERAFGVLQARFKIIREPARLWDINDLAIIMRSCIILHNMIVEGERDTYYQHWTDYDQCEANGSSTPQPFSTETPEALSRITSQIGKPLFADRNTSVQKRLGYARVCVEVKVESNMFDEIPVKYVNGYIHYQKVNYEWVPAKCMKCKMFGHSEEGCKAAQVFLPKGSTKGKGVVEDSSPDKVEMVITQFYRKLFTSQAPLNEEQKSIIKKIISARVPEDHKDQLTVVPTFKDVKRAFRSLAGGKSPMLDGFSAEFYKCNWNRNGEDLYKAVKHVFATGDVPASLNSTTITLVPKVEYPEEYEGVQAYLVM